MTAPLCDANCYAWCSIHVMRNTECKRQLDGDTERSPHHYLSTRNPTQIHTWLPLATVRLKDTEATVLERVTP
jgi:hypothetical protein